MKARVFDEPELEFGHGFHQDIRFGLIENKPFDVSENPPGKIKVSVIGTGQSIEGVSEWIHSCKGVIPRKESRKYNLFPEFPGFNAEGTFCCEAVLGGEFNQHVLPKEIQAAKSEKEYEAIIRAACKPFLQAALEVAQKNPDIILLSMPEEVIEVIRQAEEVMGSNLKRIKLEFHDLFKAEAMRLIKRPVQVIRPSTWDSKRKRSEKDKRGKARTLQDEASRAWNFFTALYYKAGGFPWRVPRDDSDFSTCYIGICFFKSADKSTTNTSIAQVFNERGYGIAVRGKEATITRDDHQPHLSEEDSATLIKQCLESYKYNHRTLPARVVIHKTSNFNEAEMKGFSEALANIELQDFLTLDESFMRLYREGYYPPLRGTWLEADEENQILYTRGSVPFYEEYPGMYVPRSLHAKIAKQTSGTEQLMRELLVLSKTNWNNVQIDGTMPITIVAARKVADILRWLPDGIPHQEAYRNFM